MITPAAMPFACHLALKAMSSWASEMFSLPASAVSWAAVVAVTVRSPSTVSAASAM